MKNLILVLFLTISYAEEIYTSFTIEAQKSANLAFSSSGIVKNVFVDVGDEVKDKEVLVVLENSDLKSLVKLNEIKYQKAKKDYERQKRVKNLIDKAQFDNSYFQYQESKTRLEYQKILLDKTELKAPFNGIIYEKIVEKGDVVSGNMIRTILKIQDNSQKLLLSFDQQYWKVVKVGDNIKFKVDGDNKIYKSKISKIYPKIDNKSRSIKVEAKVNGFIVGLFGEGYITPKN